jgi:hypothetical protein
METAVKNQPNLSFKEACARYVHRYTLQHIPQWAKSPMPNGKYCAPQYLTDQEWYDNTLFPPHALSMSKKDTSCYSNGQTWPLGMTLEAPLINSKAIASLLIEAMHYRNSGKGKEFLAKAIERAQKLNEKYSITNELNSL